jgi:hypothetical protein
MKKKSSLSVATSKRRTAEPRRVCRHRDSNSPEYKKEAEKLARNAEEYLEACRQLAATCNE